jgi:general secretion pathway protein D
MKNKKLFFQSRWMLCLQKPVAVLMAAGLLTAPVNAQPPVPVPTPPSGESENSGGVTDETMPPVGSRGGEKLLQLNFRDSPLDQVLDLIASLNGKTIIKSPGLNATITLKSQTRLNVEESMQAIEAVLAMNNITLVPMGEKFLRAVQTAQARQVGMAINLQQPEKAFNETDRLISQIFTLKHIELAEIQAIIQSLLQGYGKIQPLERANSLLVTDTEANLARITEILDFLDQPVEAKVETRIYEIRYAEASQVSSKLNELIADSQAKEERPQINVTEAAPGLPTPPGVIRARQAQAAAAQAAQGGSEVDAALQMAERGVIQGKVRIIADDRTNILFVISRTENFAFFDKIVEVLDRPIDPAITVRVVALEYAKADEIAGILNEFIGAATAEQSPAGAAAGRGSDTAAEGGATDSRSQALRDFINARAAERPAATPDAASGDANGSSIGRLSSDTKILADKRTNSLLLMGKLNDLRILEDLIDHLDIMLAQVVIEAVIIEVTLNDEIRSGVAWVQRSMIAYNETRVGPGGGVSVTEPVASFGGGTSFGVAELVKEAGAGVDDDKSLIAGGLTWFTTLYDLNIDAVIRVAQQSRDSQILSTPVVVTTDNTEAKIIASTQRPVVTTTSTTDGGSIRSSYEYRDIGINLTVTPRINPQRMVVMEITQTADDVAGEILIDGNLVPEITKRELNATVAVGDRSTIVLGGLILSRNAKSENKVPLLGDIPVLGNLFKFKSNQKQRSELVVLITPYVLMTPSEARAESTRLYSANSSRQREWHAGWSDSDMGRMTDREKADYIRNWEQNRPEPFVRELSTDLFEEDSSNDKKPRRRTLFSAEVPEESKANPEEDIELQPAVDEPEEERAPTVEPAEETFTEVTPESAGEPAPEIVEQPAVPADDYSRPVPVR